MAGPAQAATPVPVAQANYNGFATGEDVHTSALTLNSTTLAELDQAFSGSAVNSAGLSANLVDNDLNSKPEFVAANAAKNAGARGSGVEVGLAPPAPLTNQIILAQEANAYAPPSSSSPAGCCQVGPINLDPVLDASLLKGIASANFDPGGCILGTDLAHGTGEAAQLQAVGSGSPGVIANAPGDAHSDSREVFVPQTDPTGNVVGNGVGLMSQVTETLAPVGLLGGAITATVLGPWELSAVATGVPGDAFMTYGPLGSVSPSTPVVTLQTGLTPATQITLQQLLGPGGLTLPVNLTGIASVNVSIGAPPHPIGGTGTVAGAGDGTNVSGAVDIIRITVTLLNNTLLDVAVGHMEASATVPSGGIACQIDVSKTAQPQNVNPGDQFTYTINIHNPHACTLTGVKVVDSMSVTSGIRYEVLSENPAANSGTPTGVQSGKTTLTWNDVGPIAPGQTKQVIVQMKVESNSAGGTFTESANATANCAIANASGTSTIQVPASGTATIQLPTIGSGNGAALPVTGGLTGRYYAVALLIGLAGVAFGRRGFKALFTSRT